MESLSVQQLPEVTRRLRSNDPSLSSLNFTALPDGRAGMEHGEVKALAAALMANSELADLGLRATQIGDRGVEVLARALKENMSLRSLNLGDNGIGPQGARALAEALAGNMALRTLELGGNAVGSEGALGLAEFLKSNSTLEALRLGFGGIGEAGAKALAGLLEENSALRELSLIDNGIGDGGTQAVANALKRNSSLEEVDLADNTISGGAGAAALADLLRCNTPLRKLDLSVNEFGSSGAKALADALRRNSTLKALDLGGNAIGAEGVKAIAAVIQEKTALKALNLEVNRIGAEGAEALAAALPQSMGLEHLNLYGNSIVDAGAVSLAIALRVNSTLKELNLGENGISDEGALALAAAVRENSSLTRLSLGGNSVSDAVKDQIEAAIEYPNHCRRTASTAADPMQPEAWPSSQAAIPRLREIPFQELQPMADGNLNADCKAMWCGLAVAVFVLYGADANLDAVVFERLRQHPRLTQPLGLSRDPEGQRLLVTEFAPMAALDTVLRDLRDKGHSPSSLVLTQCAIQICEGLEYLCSKGLLDHDLTINDVLVFGFDPVNPCKVQLKVGFYGGRRLYIGSHKMRHDKDEDVAPLRHQDHYSMQSFGALLWEMWSLAEAPSALAGGNGDSTGWAREETLPPKPVSCPDNVYALVERCWTEGWVVQRPFQRLLRDLRDLFSELAAAKAFADPPKSGECVVCHGAPACMALAPCGHQCACQECATQLTHCPMCRTLMSWTLRVYPV